MQTIRLILISLICGPLLWLLLSTLWNGLRTGKMRWRDATSICDRRKQPLLYWLLVIVFSGFSTAIAYAWILAFKPG
jgi:hypothetical protein